MEKKSNKPKTSSQPNVPYKIQNQTIIFSSSFNKSIDEYYNIINKCKCLIFYDDYLSKFNQPIMIPINLISISMSYEFNKPIVLTPNLLSIIFNGQFNSSLVLSRQLKFLHLGFGFYQPITLSKYMSCLIHIVVNFEHDLILNKYLNELILGYVFNIENRCILPKKLYKFIFETDTIHNLKLSKNIFYLSVNSMTIKYLILPKNIRNVVLKCKSSIAFIPSPRMLRLKLCCNNCFTTNFFLEKPIELLKINNYDSFVCDNLSNSIKYIETFGDVNSKICNFPNRTKVSVIKDFGSAFDEDSDEVAFTGTPTIFKILRMFE